MIDGDYDYIIIDMIMTMLMMLKTISRFCKAIHSCDNYDDYDFIIMIMIIEMIMMLKMISRFCKAIHNCDN